MAQREQAHVIEMERKATIRKRWEKPLKQETKAKLNVQRLFQQVVLKLRLDKDGRQSDSQKTVNQVNRSLFPGFCLITMAAAVQTNAGDVVAGKQAEQELHEQLVNDSLAGDQLFFFGRASSTVGSCQRSTAAAARVDAR